MYVLDDNGDPVPVDDLLEWGLWFETHSRQLAEDFVDQRIRVSTVFLWFDHAYDDGPPVLWETMLFGEEGVPPIVSNQFYRERYTSRQDALRGHTRAVSVAQRMLQEFDAKVLDGTMPHIRSRED